LLTDKQTRWLGWSVLASVCAFVVLGTISIACYPGGTAFSGRTVGYHFWHNFICDGLDPRAMNGKPNHMGSLFGILAMAAISFGGLFPIWLLLGRTLAPRAFLGHVIRWLGACCLLGLFLLLGEALGVRPLSHTAVILVTALPGALATVLVVVLQARHPTLPKGIPVVGAVMLLASALNMALYLRVQWWKAMLTPLLPTSQKVAMLLVLCWMVWLGLHLIGDRGYATPTTIANDKTTEDTPRGMP
jgi:hypothetical protein